jgi:hypothetical protein
MLAEARKELVADAMRVDGELLRVSERRLLRVAERTALEVEQLLKLVVTGSVPRSLRGV